MIAFLLLLALLGLPPITAAAPVVILDTGDTVPAGPFLKRLRQPPENVSHSSNTSQPIGASDFVDRLLPIDSPGLAPGDVTDRDLDSAQPPGQALFLVGADERSLTWLRRHRERLAELGAIGLIVDADSVADLRAIDRAGEGVSMQPAPGGRIAERYGIAHFPVLIGQTDDGQWRIEQ